jgi:hypothetical protein
MADTLPKRNGSDVLRPPTGSGANDLAAVAKETESCLEGVPNQWEFFIVEVPEVALVWFGEWEDMPAFPSLTVIVGDLMPAGQETFCCPGFQWCPTTQSCIPLQVDCQDPIPA